MFRINELPAKKGVFHPKLLVFHRKLAIKSKKAHLQNQLTRGLSGRLGDCVFAAGPLAVRNCRGILLQERGPSGQNWAIDPQSIVLLGHWGCFIVFILTSPKRTLGSLVNNHSPSPNAMAKRNPPPRAWAPSANFFSAMSLEPRAWRHEP